MCRKTLTSLGSTALVTWRTYVATEALATGDVVYYGGSAAEAPQYRFKNGSTITIGGLDKPTRIMSAEYDIIYVQEATECTLDDIQMLSTRLRNHRISFQQLMMDCNPDSQEHWLYRRAQEGSTTLLESRHEDNPTLFDYEPETQEYSATKRGAEYIARLDRLTGVRYLRLRKGLWVTAEGVIYDEWDPSVHILQWEVDDEGERLPLPDEWERYWVIDFGYVHPFVLQCWAVDGDGNRYMYREIYMTGRTVAEHAQTIMNIVKPWVFDKAFFHPINRVMTQTKRREWIEPQPVAIICDWDAEGRRTFEKETGLGTQPAIKAVLDGINIHKDALRIDPDRGEPRVFYMEDALVERDESLVDALMPWCTVQEYTSYIWKKNQTTGKFQEEPKKDLDDGMDCSRYISMHLDWRGKARVTVLHG
jgi:phage terminase large subunit